MCTVIGVTVYSLVTVLGESKNKSHGRTNQFKFYCLHWQSKTFNCACVSMVIAVSLTGTIMFPDERKKSFHEKTDKL